MMKPFKRCLRHIAAGLFFAGPLLAAAQSLPTTSPERVGLSSERLQMLTDVLKDAMWDYPSETRLVRTGFP